MSTMEDEHHKSLYNVLVVVAKQNCSISTQAVVLEFWQIVLFILVFPLPLITFLFTSPLCKLTRHYKMWGVLSKIVWAGCSHVNDFLWTYLQDVVNSVSPFLSYLKYFYALELRLIFLKFYRLYCKYALEWCTTVAVAVNKSMPIQGLYQVYIHVHLVILCRSLLSIVASGNKPTGTAGKNTWRD